MSGTRYPGYDVLDQRENWDGATRSAIEQRLRPRPGRRFFTEQEEATCRPLLDRLLANDEEPTLPLFEQLDRRLALDLTDGYRYEDMPPDPRAWRISLKELDGRAEREHGRRFHELGRAEQVELLARIKDSECLGPLPVKRLWSLWLRHACAAFYSHPASWSEIGFGGPAYPRGYKNIGLDAREPWEVPDADPGADPLRRR